MNGSVRLSIRGFICKKYFLEVLLQETKSNTYVPYQDSAESIINAVAKKCLDIGIPVKENTSTDTCNY